MFVAHSKLSLASKIVLINQYWNFTGIKSRELSNSCSRHKGGEGSAYRRLTPPIIPRFGALRTGRFSLAKINTTPRTQYVCIANTKSAGFTGRSPFTRWSWKRSWSRIRAVGWHSCPTTKGSRYSVNRYRCGGITPQCSLCGLS